MTITPQNKHKRPVHWWARGFKKKNMKTFHPYCCLDFDWPNLDDGVKALKIKP
jgi:hypothetical protein